jgi:hypothetical protein
MFVPELGQTNNTIQKRIALSDLVFSNSFTKKYELSIEKNLNNMSKSPLHFIKMLFFPEKKANTVGGMLFTV